MTSGAVSARTWQVLDMLADGNFHSGEALADRLGISRASIFNALVDVADHGVQLQRIRGRGYRLARPWQRLDAREVARWLGPDAGGFDIDIMLQAASSNTLMLQRVVAGAPAGSVLAVELQTDGRGRMGRRWFAGLGTALTFSLAWRFECGLNALSGLSLAVGVAIVRAVNALGGHGVRLKWPNDVLTEQGKLAGVLIEAQGDMLGPSAVVIGIGLNCSLPASLIAEIGQPASALEDICTPMPSRDQLLAALLRELATVLRQFSADGFGALRGEWQHLHANRDKPVSLLMPDGQAVQGIARGVDASGALCLETAQGKRYFNSGEVGTQPNVT